MNELPGCFPQIPEHSGVLLCTEESFSRYNELFCQKKKLYLQKQTIVIKNNLTLNFYYALEQYAFINGKSSVVFLFNMDT